MTQHNAQTIQRLVDGELDCQDRAQFLQSIDHQPHLWREIALAFVEDQSWREHTLAESVDPLPSSQATYTPEKAKTKPVPWYQIKGPSMMLIAAGVLLAATIIMRFDNSGLGPGGSQSTAYDSLDERPVEGPDYTLRVDDQVDVPLYRLDQLPKEFNTAGFEIAPAMQKQFMESGYQIQPDMRFIQGHSPDGRPFIIPVQGLRIFQYVQ